MMKLVKPALAAISIGLLAGCSATPDTTALVSDNSFDLTDTTRFTEISSIVRKKHVPLYQERGTDSEGNSIAATTTDEVEVDSMRVFLDLSSTNKPVCIKKVRFMESLDTDTQGHTYPTYVIQQAIVACPESLTTNEPS